MMIQQLFSYMHDTLRELEHEFNTPVDMDQELSLLEKYLTIKEMIEDISDELGHLQTKLKQFETDHGLVLNSMEEVKKGPEEEEEVIELDESDFLDFQKGIGFFDLWMYDQAVIHLEKIMEKYPDFNLARLYTAMTYFQKENYNEAKQQLNILFSHTEDNDLLSLGHNLLGMIDGKNKKYEEAIAEFQQAILYRHDWYEPKFNQAMANYHLGHYQDTILLLKEIVNQKPLDWEIAFYLGKSYQNLNHVAIANEWFKKVYDMTKQPKMIQQIASNFEKRKQYPQAIYWLEKWHKFEPQRSEPLLALIKDVWLMGEKERAKTLLKKYFSAYPETLEALLLYAWILTNEAEEQKLAFIVNKLISFRIDESKQNDPAYLASLARLFSIHQYPKDSNDFLKFLLDSEDTYVKGLAYMVKGMSQLDLNNPREALEHFEMTIQAGVHFPNFEIYIGYAHYLLGNTDDANYYWKQLQMDKNLS
ncbi:hypothetical protein [Tepidibacillus marianensis]|uniref:tetratricopeptide repeat protein n=1 Tax=Tepidibacillus marianensis TaxID=3131995 RepID=UPI0030CBCD00